MSRNLGNFLLAHLIYRLGEQVIRLSPKIYRHLGFWRQHRDIHGNRVRVRWCAGTAFPLGRASYPYP